MFVLLLVSLGILTAFAVPAVLADRERVFDDRQASLPPPGAASVFQHSTIQELWQDRPITVVYLAEVSPFATAPPGIERMPEPGEYFVSPALATLSESDRSVAGLLPGAPIGEITEEGLLGPDERIAYVGVSSSRLPEGAPGVGWGSGWADDLAQRDRGTAPAVMLLVLPAALGAMWLCLRLAARSTVKRWSALRILGVRRSQVLTGAAIESALPCLLGSLGAALLAGVVLSRLAVSDLLGFTWFHGRAGFGWEYSLGFCALMTLIGACFGAGGTRRALANPVRGRQDHREPSPRWWHLLPLAAGIGIVLPPLLTRPPAEAGQDVTAGSTFSWMLVGGVAVCLIGLLWAARPITWGLARMLDRPQVALPVRLAARRVGDAPGAHLRSIAAIALLVLVAGANEGAEETFAKLYSQDGGAVVASFDPAQIPDVATRELLWERTPEPKWVDQLSGAGQGAVLVTASCTTLESLGIRGQDCAEGEYYAARADRCHLGPAPRLPAGSEHAFDSESGAPIVVTVPDAELSVDDPHFDCNTVIFTGDAPPFGWGAWTRVSAVLDAGAGSALEYRALLYELAPGLDLATSRADLNQDQWARQATTALGFALWTAFGFATLTFTMALADRIAFRRRDSTALMVLGVRPSQLRASQVVEVGLGIAGAVGLMYACAILFGSVLIKLGDARETIAWRLAPALTPYVATAAVVAIAAALIVGPNLRSEDMRRE
ncbi:hypothetical protein [Glycomyces sp. NRRL B-16210]|uniref:hypothetical protein n=1 Tax=Glycomyces sp. NRRL B-16210 TaxID=1463821 RepID=UPI0004BEB061|nr:hypothetical protein [Glycomyces sp. NRRL B-16210]